MNNPAIQKQQPISTDSNSSFPAVTYGCLLKRLRERYHISQIELSKRTDLSVSFISSVENGLSPSSIINADDICKALMTPFPRVHETAVWINSLTALNKTYLNRE